MEHAENGGHLLVPTHRVGDPDAGVEAGEHGPEESDEDGGGHNQGKHRTHAASEDDVAHVLDHGADRGRVGGRGGVAGEAAAAHRAAHHHVGGEVLEHVHHQSLDGERQEDAAADVLLGVLCLGPERGYGLEADQEQDGDRALTEDAREAVVAGEHGADGVVVVQPRVGDAEDDREEGKGDQRDQLDDVDHDRGHGRPADAPEGDVGVEQGEDQDHRDQQPRGGRVPGGDAVEVSEEDAAECGHDPGVDPVVEVGQPAHRELGHPGEAAVVGLLLVEERGLGEVVGGPGPGPRIAVGQLGVRVSGEKGQDQCEGQTDPHVARRRHAADRLARLTLEGGPEKGPGRDQGHGVDGDAGQAERLLHPPRAAGHAGTRIQLSGLDRHDSPPCVLRPQLTTWQ